MFSRILFVILIFLFSTEVNAQQNLTLVKNQLIKYYDSGAYFADIQKVINKAKINLMYLVQHKSANEKLAIVLDIDDTAISNYPDLKSVDFGGNYEMRYQLLLKGNEPAIKPTLSLYQLAIKNNVAVFFVTGRPENVKNITEKVLRDDGYATWAGIYFKADGYQKMSASEYKTTIRKIITQQGYKIIENIGDQESDLKGGYAIQRYKLPNPFYYIP